MSSEAVTRRDRPRRWRAVFFAVTAVAIVAGAGWALLGSKFLVVRSVRVVGADRLVTQARVLAAAQVPADLPMLRVSAAQVARRVERIPQVASARVSRDWPDTVVITVRPRVPVFAVSGPGGYLLVDPAGVAVRAVARRPPAMPLLTLGTGVGSAALAGNPAVRSAAEVLRNVPARLARQVSSVEALSESDVSLRLSDGVTIIWGGPGGARRKSRELAILMRTHARLYDVSAPGTALTRN